MPLTLEKATQIAGDWYARAGKHPMRIPNGWRWILPDPPGKEDETSELPSGVFAYLFYNGHHCWCFPNRRDAILGARIAAVRFLMQGGRLPGPPKYEE